jgi:hypothetical protein
MAQTNHMAASLNARSARKAKASRENGAKGGRPLGAKDRHPRKRTPVPEDRLEQLEAALGQAYKERDDFKRQVDDLRFQLNYGKQFPGDSKALLTATYKAEYYPRQEQLYAAKILLDREYPLAEPGQYETDKNGKIVLYLPHNGRDPLRQSPEDAEEAANWYVDQLKKRKRASILDWDSWLHQQIASGEITEAFALKVRARITERRAPADQEADNVGVEVPDWEPVQKPASDPVARLIAQIEVAPQPRSPAPGVLYSDNITMQEPHPAPNGHAPQVQVRMLTSPRKVFSTRSGKRYEADVNGDLWCDEEDKAEIAGQGATEWR